MAVAGAECSLFPLHPPVLLKLGKISGWHSSLEQLLWYCIRAARRKPSLSEKTKCKSTSKLNGMLMAQCQLSKLVEGLHAAAVPPPIVVQASCLHRT
eukprot:863953-Pelagomonas_calceolata.AAC.1